MLRRSSILILYLTLSSVLGFPQARKLDGLLEAGHFSNVARAFDPNNIHDAQGLYLLSKVKQSFGETDEALRLAEAAVKADPKQPRYHLQLAGVLSDEAKKANLLKKVSLAGRIRSELQTAVKLDPRNTDCLLGMMTFYEVAPRMARGNKEKARQLANEIARIDASKGYLAKARLARFDNQNDDVEHLYLEALKADPTSFEAIVAFADYYASGVGKKYALKVSSR